MGLRLGEGVDLHRIVSATGIPVEQLIIDRGVERLSALGLVERRGARLRVEPRGMILLDAILPQLVA